MKRILYTALLALSTGITASAQGWVDQVATVPIVESQVGSIKNIEKVNWTVYEYGDHNPNDKKGQ